MNERDEITQIRINRKRQCIITVLGRISGSEIVERVFGQ